MISLRSSNSSRCCDRIGGSGSALEVAVVSDSVSDRDCGSSRESRLNNQGLSVAFSRDK